jgi:hypothetical protein
MAVGAWRGNPKVRFALDSALEGDGFEPSVSREGNYTHEIAELTASAFPLGLKGTARCDAPEGSNPFPSLPGLPQGRTP